MSNPSLPDYWEDWYEDGPGKKEYEWYNITLEDVTKQLKSHLLPHSNILQIGMGNSLILESILDELPSLKDCSLTNIDISSKAVEQMHEKQKIAIQKNLNGFLSRSQYLQMDATSLVFEDGSWDNVFDKGTIDALLSHGEEETGEDEQVAQVLSEVYRVLKPGGKFFLISGNGDSTVHPYLYSFDWKVDSLPIQRTAPKNKIAPKVDFGSLNVTLYIMHKG